MSDSLQVIRFELFHFHFAGEQEQGQIVGKRLGIYFTFTLILQVNRSMVRHLTRY